MSLLRRAIVRGAPQMSKIGRGLPVKQVAVRNFATSFDAREQVEETKFIRDREGQQKAKRMQEVERILALEEGAPEREELMQLLDKKEEPKGLLAQWGLDDWKYAAPVGLIFGIPLITQEIYVLDCETQVVACFMLFCATMYNEAGPMIKKQFVDYRKEIWEALKKADDAALSEIQTQIKNNQTALVAEDDFKNYIALSDAIAVAQAEALNNREEHMYREAIIKKLDSLAALEESATNQIRTRMLTQVKADVVNTFTNDKKMKEASLNRAIEILAGGAKGTMGKDLVGEVFQQALVNYRESYAKQPAGSDPILKQLEKDMAAVATAPVVESKGGNTFAM